MNRFLTLRPAGVLLVAVAILALPDRASAEERRHSSRGTAHFDSPTGFVGKGLATHLGNYTESAFAIFSPTDEPGILRIDALAIYTAANRDQLYAIVTGELNGATGAITATVTYVGGTGRFKQAVGSATLSGQMLPGGTISVTVEGTIDY
jgi:hypothetical protein